MPLQLILWIENNLTSAPSVLFNGETIPKADLRINGGLVCVSNSGLTIAHAGNNTIVTLKNCVFLEPFIFTKSGTGTFNGNNIIGDEQFFPFRIESGTNDHDARSFGFYTKPKVNKSRALIGNSKYGETHGRDSVITGNFGSTITKVAEGVMDNICWEISAPNNAGIITTPIPITVGKIYVSTYNIRTNDSPFELLSTFTYLPKFMNQKVQVTNKWESIAVVGRGIDTAGGVTVPGANEALLYNVLDGLPHTFQISGWQILQFDTIGELYEFLQTSDFAVENSIPLTSDNSSSDLPVKFSAGPCWPFGKIACEAVTFDLAFD